MLFVKGHYIRVYDKYIKKGHTYIDRQSVSQSVRQTDREREVDGVVR